MRAPIERRRQLERAQLNPLDLTEVPRCNAIANYNITNSAPRTEQKGTAA